MSELVLDCKRKPAEEFIPIFKLGVLEKFPEKLLYWDRGIFIVAVPAAWIGEFMFQSV